jgi:hypothetical protein
MAHLTLQEVIDRINNNYPPRKRQNYLDGVRERASYHPEFYVPRVTRFFAGLLLGAFPAGRMAVVQKQNDPHSVSL